MMVSKFEDFNKNDDYILCLPSGEVIFTHGINTDYLFTNNIIYKDKKEPIPLRCSDFLSHKVKKYINDILSDSNEFDKKDISNFLSHCGILQDQYTINSDLSVDVFSSVNLSYMNIKEIPIKFNKCTSNFNCSHNELTTLKNCPTEVHGNFDCSYNKLENLKGGPLRVYRSYNCSYNNLNSLIGSPKKVENFNCSYNFLEDLRDAPSVKGNFIIKNNLL